MSHVTRCNEADCERPGIKRGYCNAHYERRRRAGEFAASPRTPEERFWSRVEKTDTCWLWRGGLAHGYGYWNNRGAHRISYELLIGPIPEGLHIDHLCRVRNCVNPAHLEPVTPAENLRRGVGMSALNAAKTHCPNGHPYSEENTYTWHSNRQCLTCRTAISTRRAANLKAERAARREVTEQFDCIICGGMFSRPAGDSRRLKCSDECKRRSAAMAAQRHQQKNR